MATARRLYLYVVAGIGLGLILSGGITLLRLILEAAGVPKGVLSVYEIPDPNANKEALSLAVAYVAVGLPIWLIHWGFIERFVRRPDAVGAEERGSLIRSLFFLLAMAYLLYVASTSLFTGLREWLSGPLGTADPNYLYGYWIVSVADNLAAAAMLGLAWAYHASVRARDIRIGPPPVEGAARGLRLYMYGAALVALAVTLQALMSLGGTLVDVAGGHVAPIPAVPGFPPSQVIRTVTAAWWVWPVLSSLLSLAVVVPIWISHFAYSNRLLRPSLMGREESTSRMRLVYFVGVVLVAVAAIVGLFSQALAALFGQPLHASDPGGYTAWRNLAAALVVVIAPAAILFFHRRRAIAEAVGGDPVAPGPSRVINYAVSLFGIAAFGYGLVTALTALFQVWRGTGGFSYFDTATTDPRPWAAAQGLGYAAVGLVIWLWPWLAAQRRHVADRLIEATAPSRRYYLLAVVGASLVAGALGLATLIYRATRAAVGISSGQVGDNISDSLALVVVAAPLLAYHLLVLWSDFRTAAKAAPTAPIPAEASFAGLPALPPSPVPGPELVIVGPPGADIEGLRGVLVPWLPAGYRVELRQPD